MNERIRELALQAFFETEYDDTQNLHETMERFAELIVRECAELCDINDREQGDILREHFGVE